MEKEIIKERKVLIISILMIILIVMVSMLYTKLNERNNNYIILKNSTKQITASNNIALMYETSSGSGEYAISSDSTWPTGDYAFNANLSKCENGSKISYDETTKKVIVEANAKDKCYVYFDIKATLANYIKNLYSTNGTNNLYLHDSNLANSANDGSIRYAGPSNTTNNYICFGSDAEACPSNNLYRIIGVFDNRVKLIKNTSLGRYAWDGDELEVESISDIAINHESKDNLTGILAMNLSDHIIAAYLPGAGEGYNNWNESSFNKTDLNDNFLNSFATKYKNMIESIKWNIGGYTATYATTKTFYDAEKTEQTTEAYKIGLMSVSDYGYATLPSNWSTYLDDYGTNTISDNNWLFTGLMEWTITKNSSDSINVFVINIGGRLEGNVDNSANSIRDTRPTFYLKQDVQYAKGNGTSSNPFRIK